MLSLGYYFIRFFSWIILRLCYVVLVIPFSFELSLDIHHFCWNQHSWLITAVVHSLIFAFFYYKNRPFPLLYHRQFLFLRPTSNVLKHHYNRECVHPDLPARGGGRCPTLTCLPPTIIILPSSTIYVSFL